MTFVLVFSRDRAMQLDATLRSFFLHCNDPERIHLSVLYLASDATHKKQYEYLVQEYLGRVQFVSQSQFDLDVLGLLALNGNPLMPRLWQFTTSIGKRLSSIPSIWAALCRHCTVLFLVDDNLFVRSFRLSPIQNVLQSQVSALGFSLRLGTNTTSCYSMNMAQALPAFTSVEQDIFRFRWVGAEGDFGYPLELSSSLYRISDVFPLLNRITFKNPNTLESEIATRAPAFRFKRPDLLCFNQSVAFCNPINKVQTTYDNRAGTTVEYTSDHLAEMFDSGWRIDVNAMSGFIPNACHQEVKLHFTRDENL